MACPEFVVIGPYEYEIVFKKKIKDSDDASRDLLGETVRQKERIYVKRGQGPGQERDTVLHEVMHGITDMIGLTDLEHDLEERIVRLMSTATLDLLRRNPLLVEYLTD